MQAALATAVVGAFVLIMFVDTRVALLALLLVRASFDYFATIPFVAVGGGINTNALMFASTYAGFPWPRLTRSSSEGASLLSPSRLIR
jgi:hypothetical protein